MDILEKITKLRLEHHWSMYQLAKKSGLPQSTISSWYNNNMLPTIHSLQCICDAFDISLSQFFLDDSSDTVKLNEKQIRLLNATSKLNDKQQDALYNFIDTL
jgi:transcriptional regulator with XRE-family HTH domain